MVTINNQTTHYNGLSTDTKPTEGRNGDTFVEIDTGKTYLWNADGSEWVEQPASGGGGGEESGSGGSLMLRITKRTAGVRIIFRLNASFNDIKNAIENGRMVYLINEEIPIGASEGALATVPCQLECAVYTPPDFYLVRFQSFDQDFTSDTPDGELSDFVLNSQ